MNDFLSGFEDWTQAFSDWTDISISELHGLMTALVCAVKPPTSDEWVKILGELSFAVPNDKALALLSEYGEDVSFALKDKDDAYEFTPLVPDDEHDLYERLVALKDWAGGFITGIGVADLYLKDDELEMLGDLSKIASLRPDPDELYADDGLEEDSDDELSDDGSFGGGFSDDFEDDWQHQKPQKSAGNGEAMYLQLYEFARMVPVALAVRNKKEVKDLAIIKGLAQGRKTAQELEQDTEQAISLPPVVDVMHKH